MKPRSLAIIACSLVFLASCADNPATAPTPTSTPARLSITLTPNPLAAPAPDGEVTWTMALRAGNHGDVLLDRGEAKLLDAAGNVVGSLRSFWSQSTGCTACSTDFKVPAGGASSWWQHTYVTGMGGAPVRFTLTLQFVDDLGPGSTTVEVPVR